ncbi:MAG: S-layer homology domain-containing protein [Oscillospiraceae bacterium]|jgi:hypothetical protein|nr:S-layer homology domain-containing protein [Oscillospiraceae bacterium]
MKRVVALGVLLALAIANPCGRPARAAADFADVPPGHWAAAYIRELRGLGVTDGVGNNRFGLGRSVTRAEFASFLCKLMRWEEVQPAEGHFEDNRDGAQWYYGFIETALAHGAILADAPRFEPNEAITREAMAVMIVRALGYDALGAHLAALGSPFPDVTGYAGYITIAKDLEIINGMSPTRFAPGETALREHAAAMMMRMYWLEQNRAGFSNAFYAIRSAGQMDMVPSFDAVSFGWSRLALSDGVLTLHSDAAGGHEYFVPEGYEEPLGKAKGETLLMAAVSAADSVAIIGDGALRAQAAQLLADAARAGVPAASGGQPAFDGIVVDFETLRGAQARDNFSRFLADLRAQMPAGRRLYVAVHPRRRPGVAVYDGYDYRAIGALADRVILMAHDYYPKRLTQDERESGVTHTPAAPLDEVYYALRAVCDPDTGVEDRSRVLLQISFDAVQWKARDGVILNETPYAPAYSAIEARIQAGASVTFDPVAQSPYIAFRDTQDQTDNIVWYEDARSVAAKAKLAARFGLGGLSYWRLGLIPDGVTPAGR